MVDGSDWSVIRERGRATPTCGAASACQHWLQVERARAESSIACCAGWPAAAPWPASPSCSSAIWPALWPPLGVAGAVRLRRPARPAAPAAALVAYRAARRRPRCHRSACWYAACAASRAPDDTAADRRLEIASGLAHRPLAVLTDRPSRGSDAGPDTAPVALWQAHVARAVRSGAPAARRPAATRAGAARSAGRCARRWWWRWSPHWRSPATMAPSRLAQAHGADAAARAAAAGDRAAGLDHAARLHRLAPIFLKPDGGTVSVPAGARLTVSVTGGSGARRRWRWTATPSRSARSTRRASRPTAT